MSIKKRYQYIILFSIVTVGVCIAILQTRKLESDFIVTSGHIDEVQTFPQSVQIFATYHFEAGGIINKHQSPIPRSSRSSLKIINRFLVGSWLPVVYENGNPQNSIMIFTKDQALKFKINLDKPSVDLLNRIDSLRERNILN